MESPNNRNLYEVNGPVEEAIKLGGVIENVQKDEEFNNREEQVKPKDVIHENMGGKGVIITEDGSQIDEETGETILQGSTD